MRKAIAAISCLGIGVTIWPFQWGPLWRVQRFSDRYGLTMIITIGPIDLQLSSDWGGK